MLRMKKEENSFGKKAQISIFVIIGVILVIVASFLLFNGKIEFFQSHDTKLKSQISQVVKDCIYDSTTQATFLLGFQAGYIDIPKSVSSDPRKYTDFGLKIPNWDSQKLNIPDILSMEKEVNNFIKDEGYQCIVNNLKAMESSFDITIDENFEVTTLINEGSVTVDSELLIRFNEKNSEEVLTINDYYVKVESLRLGDLYNLAAEIYNLESNTYMFEKLVLDQIQTANDYSSPFSMPTEGMSITCGKKVWTIPQLKDNLVNMNNNNFKYLQFDGTYSKDYLFELNLNDEFGSTKYQDYFKKQYFFELKNPKPSFSQYEVEILVPSSKITGKEGIFQRYPFRNFDVTPSSGQIVKSMDMDVDLGAQIPIPCIQVFHHLYDLDYDLIVKLTDRNDDGENYYFQFPLRVEIKSSTAKVRPVSIITPEPRTVNNDKYCSNESKEYPLLVVAYDTDDNVLADVNISYKCLSLKCDMGTTNKPTFMGVIRQHAPAQLEADFPFCIGGKVVAEKSGYHTVSQRTTTDDSLLRRESFVGDNLIELTMISKKSFLVTPEMFLMKDRETGLGKRVIDKNDGLIYITIENKKYDFESQAMLPNEENFLDTIEFLEEENVLYNLSIIYMDSSNNLKGLFEIENWNPKIDNANKIQFLIPSSEKKIEEDNYIDFYDYVEEKSQSIEYAPRFY